MRQHADNREANDGWLTAVGLIGPVAGGGLSFYKRLKAFDVNSVNLGGQNVGGASE